jgi:hypothetical protein
MAGALVAVTRHLIMNPPSQSSGLRFPLELRIYPPPATWGRHPPPVSATLPLMCSQPPTANRHHPPFAQAAGRFALLHTRAARGAAPPPRNFLSPPCPHCHSPAHVRATSDPS